MFTVNLILQLLLCPYEQKALSMSSASERQSVTLLLVTIDVILSLLA